MTTARSAFPEAARPDRAGVLPAVGARRQLRSQRRRQVREEALAVLALLLALVITLVLLGMQWLDTGPTGAGAAPAVTHVAPGGRT